MKQSSFSSRHVIVDDSIPSMEDSHFVKHKLKLAMTILGPLTFTTMEARTHAGNPPMSNTPPVVPKRDKAN